MDTKAIAAVREDLAARLFQNLCRESLLFADLLNELVEEFVEQGELDAGWEEGG